MPYVPGPKSTPPDELTRQELEPTCSRPAADKAELNYQICRLVDRFLQGQDGTIGYDLRSDAHAAMIDAAGEFKRRFIDPYEDKKKAENGDVFHESLWGKSL